MSEGPDRIDPSGIPEFTGSLDQLLTDANDLARDARTVRGIGRQVDRRFQGLSEFYRAPEAEDLFATTAPVRSGAEDFATDLQSVSNALRMYQGEITPLVLALDRLRGEAQAFRAAIADDKHWDSKQSNIDRNNELLREVSQVVGRFWDAERSAANKILALFSSVRWTADDGSGGRHMYGVSTGELDQAGQTPWGRALERSPRWYEVHHHLKSFVWDGIVVDGIWGTLVGLGSLVGLGGWEAFKESWKGLGQLATGLAIVTSPLGALTYAAMPEGAVRDWMDDSLGTTKEVGKALVAWDTWEDDPARAAGAVTFNVVTTVFTGGAGAGVKAGGIAGTLAKVAATTSRVGTYLDPASLAFQGIRTVGKIPNLGTVLDDLGRVSAKGADIPPGSLRLPDGSVQLPDGHRLFPDGRLEAPDGRTVQSPDQVPVESAAGRRVPEPAAVGGGAAGPPGPPDPPGPVAGHLGDGSGPGPGAGGGDGPSPGGSGGGDGPGGGQGTGGGHDMTPERWDRMSPEDQIRFAESEIKRDAAAFADDADAMRYGAENWNSYAENMPAAQREAVYHYTLESSPDWPTYREINGYLRGDDALGTPEVLRHIEDIDNALAGNPVPENVTVVRGTGLSHFGMDPDAMVGRTFTDDAYMSTSLGGPAPAFASNEAVLHLRVPEGTPALWVERVSAFGAGERELLMGRGTRYTITHAIFQNGQWQLYGEVLPR